MYTHKTFAYILVLKPTNCNIINWVKNGVIIHIIVRHVIKVIKAVNKSTSIVCQWCYYETSLILLKREDLSINQSCHMYMKNGIAQRLVEYFGSISSKDIIASLSVSQEILR